MPGFGLSDLQRGLRCRDRAQTAIARAPDDEDGGSSGGVVGVVDGGWRLRSEQNHLGILVYGSLLHRGLYRFSRSVPVCERTRVRLSRGHSVRLF